MYRNRLYTSRLYSNSNSNSNTPRPRYSTEELSALEYYVKENEVGIPTKHGTQINTVSVESRIFSMLKKTPPIESTRVFWRGQDSPILRQSQWISVSSKQSVAKDFGDHVFEIHVQPGIPVLDVNTILQSNGLDKGMRYANESEFIIGLGTFRRIDGTRYAYSPHVGGKRKTMKRRLKKHRTIKR